MSIEESTTPLGFDRVRFQLVTGKMPFPELMDCNVIVAVSEGKRPQRPRQFDATGMTPAVWEIAQKCWHRRAKERPEANAVLRSLKSLANSGVYTHRTYSCLE